MNHATQILQQAVKEMASRAKTYENEAACEARNGGWTPEEIKAAAFPAGERKFFPLYSEEDEKRINQVGQNGNDGLHYHIAHLESLAQKAPLWVTRIHWPGGCRNIYGQSDEGRCIILSYENISLPESVTLELNR